MCYKNATIILWRVLVNKNFKNPFKFIRPSLSGDGSPKPLAGVNGVGIGYRYRFDSDTDTDTENNAMQRSNCILD